MRILKNSEKLENALKNVEDALLEFRNTISEVQEECVPSPDTAEIELWQILASVDKDIEGMRNRVSDIKIKIAQLKDLENMQ